MAYAVPVGWGPVYWMVIHLNALQYATEMPYKAPCSDEEFEAMDKDAKRVEMQVRNMFEQLHEAHVSFMRNLVVQLPCPDCRNHLNMHYNNFPPEAHILRTSGTDAFFKYTVDLHNVVNATKGKDPMSHEDAREYYDSLFSLQNKAGLARLMSIDAYRKAEETMRRRVRKLENGDPVLKDKNEEIDAMADLVTNAHRTIEILQGEKVDETRKIERVQTVYLTRESIGLIVVALLGFVLLVWLIQRG